MLLDAKLDLFVDEDISGSASAETISENVFDAKDSQKRYSSGSSGDPIILNAAINDLGRSGKAMLFCAVGATGWYASGGTADVDIRLYEHTGATVTSGNIILSVNIPGVVVTTPAAHVAAGQFLFGLLLPKDIWGDTTNYYIGLSAIVLTQTITAATLNAWIGENRI